jgi:hypothetical protein
MIEWCVIIYFLLSFLVMNVIQPQNDEHPVLNTIICFLVGGAIFIIAFTWGLVRLFRGKLGDDE